MKELSGCVGCLIGSLPRAFFSFLIFGVVYKMIFPGPVTNSYECARGNFYGYLSILMGGLIGGLLLGYAAYKVSSDKGGAGSVSEAQHTVVDSSDSDLK